MVRVRIPWWAVLGLVLWLAHVIPCVDWCPPPEQRPLWMMFAVYFGWPWCCE